MMSLVVAKVFVVPPRLAGARERVAARGQLRHHDQGITSTRGTSALGGLLTNPQIRLGGV